MVPSSFDDVCVKGASTKRFLNDTPLGNVTVSNNFLYLLFISNSFLNLLVLLFSNYNMNIFMSLLLCLYALTIFLNLAIY